MSMPTNICLTSEKAQFSQGIHWFCILLVFFFLWMSLLPVDQWSTESCKYCPVWASPLSHFKATSPLVASQMCVPVTLTCQFIDWPPVHRHTWPSLMGFTQFVSLRSIDALDSMNAFLILLKRAVVGYDAQIHQNRQCIVSYRIRNFTFYV